MTPWDSDFESALMALMANTDAGFLLGPQRGLYGNESPGGASGNHGEVFR